MRLAIPVASKYRRYGAPMNDLIQEASVGLMKAAHKFDPDRGVRFSTYAVWWVRASIQDYVMRNWSLVRTGSTSSQKSLFFNMRRVRAKLEREAYGVGIAVTSQELRVQIAEELGCPLRDVEMMEVRLAGSDFSLNAPQLGDEGRAWVETLEDEGLAPEEQVSRDSDIVTAREWLVDALNALTDREKVIIAARTLADKPETLESLGIKLGLSKERVRQLEAQALRKMKKRLESRHGTAPRQLVVA
jgi:RNA polymerase sigma-32 factor